MNPDIKVGDIVEATTHIRRYDGKSEIGKGQRAKVLESWRTTPESPCVVMIQPPSGKPIGSIVCSEHGPLKLAENE